MPGKHKTASKDHHPHDVPRPAEGIKPALAPVAIALTEELAALLAAVLDGRKKRTLDRLSHALSDAVPALLERAFEHELLDGSDAARKRRAALMAVLTASDTPADVQPAKTAGKPKADGMNGSQTPVRGRREPARSRKSMRGDASRTSGNTA